MSQSSVHGEGQNCDDVEQMKHVQPKDEDFVSDDQGCSDEEETSGQSFDFRHESSSQSSTRESTSEDIVVDGSSGAEAKPRAFALDGILTRRATAHPLTDAQVQD